MGALLKLIPPWVFLALLFGLATMGVVTYQAIELSHARADSAILSSRWNAERQELTAAALTATTERNALEKKLAATVKEAEDVRQKTIASSARVVAGLRAERDGMRDQLAAYAAPGGDSGAGDSLAACRDRAAVLGDVLGGALRTEEDLTDALERSGADTRSLLSAWPRVKATSATTATPPPAAQ